jgi:threonine aldolase
MNDRQARIAAQAGETRELRKQCAKFLPGHPAAHPSEEYEKMAAWIRANGAEPDVYGQGVFLNAFERRIADLLGYEAAAFMPSGTMAQQIALRLWSDQAGCRHVGIHPTSHLELHEHRAYSHVHGLQATLVGPKHRPMLASDLPAERLAAVLVELPIRESGGKLPAWEELEALKSAAKERGVRLHLDGARLWETRAGFGGRSYAEICRGFDSAYVSFYKGIGALCGAMLLGPAAFIREARIWQRRHGGNLYQVHPFAVSAAMNFDARLQKMPEFFQRAKALAAAFSTIEGVIVNPQPPHINMMHVHVAVEPEKLTAARNRVAREDRIWLFGAAQPADTPGWSYFEIYVGENALALDVAEAARAVKKLLS